MESSDTTSSTLIRKVRHEVPEWTVEPHLAWDPQPANFIQFLHPGYEDLCNGLISLPAADNGGVHFGTALTICGIIANNAFNGRFAKERNGNPEECGWDSVLRGDKFYFLVSDNPDDKYPVVTSFEHWQFPRTLPPEWNDLAIQGGASTMRACCLSLIRQALDWSHIVPQSESEWFRTNLQQRGGRFRCNDDSENLITLRADIHRVFDSKMWCVVLKEGRLVCQTFVPYGSKEFPDEFMKIYHNVGLQPIFELQPIFGKMKECLFARIAWTVLPLEHFCAIRQDKPKTFIIKNGKSQEASGQELMDSSKRDSTDVTTSATLSNAVSGRKRALDDEPISISVLDWLSQVPSPHPEGYPPVATGDYLHDRYRIVDKLDFGTYSTVWLARDEKAGRYVAIKIASAQMKDDPQESIRSLGDNESPFILPVLDEFSLNGKYRCVVTVATRMSVAEAQAVSHCRLFELPTARAIVAQLILAVSHSHSQGIVHGDLHRGNILLHLPKSLHGMSTDELYDKLVPEPVVIDKWPLPEGVPKDFIVLEKNCRLPLDEAEIFLSGFGESFVSSITQRYHSSIETLVPPEIYFQPQKPLSFLSDIWSLACTIWAIISLRPLFEAFIPNADNTIVQHVESLGKLPPEWWQKWDNRLEWYNDEGASLNGDNTLLEELFESEVQMPRREVGMLEVDEEEKAALLDMLKGMMAFEPDKRVTAEQTKKSKWMRKWGLPGVQTMKRKQEYCSMISG